MKKKITVVLIMLAAAIGMQAAVSVTATLTERNVLQGALEYMSYTFGTNGTAYNITELKVTGPLGNDDIRVLRELAGCDREGNSTTGTLTRLDLSDAYFVKDGTSDDEHNKRYYYLNTAFLTDSDIPDIKGDNSDFDNHLLYTFTYSSDNLNVGDKIDILPPLMFAKCPSIKEVVLPSNTTDIGFGAFLGSGMERFSFPSQTKYIRQYVFKDCQSLLSLDYSAITTPLEEGGVNGAHSIGYGVALNCPKLNEVTLPSQTSITFLPGECFRYCSSLTKFIIPNNSSTDATLDLTPLSSLQFIDGCAFQGTQFKNVILPSSLTHMADKVFKGCTSLTDITVNSTRIDCYRDRNNVSQAWLNDNYEAVVSGPEDDTKGCVFGMMDWRKCVLHFEGDAIANIDNYRGQPGWKHLLEMDVYSDATHNSYSDNEITYKNQQGATIWFHRTMKNSNWYTMVLPFDMTREHIEKAFGYGTYVALFKRTSINGENVTLDFHEVYTPNSASTSFAQASVAIPANTPFIIKPGNSQETYAIGFDNLENNKPVAPGVNINNDGTMQYSTNNGTATRNFEFVGVYKTIDKLNVGSYFIKDNAFHRVRDIDALALRPFRAYFTAPTSSPNPAKAALLLTSIDGTTTGISNIDNETNTSHSSGKIYNLDGQLVRDNADSLDGLNKGIYIVNGKKYVVR